MRHPLPWLVCILLVPQISVPTSAHELSAEVIGVLDAAIQADELEANRIRSGTGSAIVKRTGGPYQGESRIHFWYQGGSRRTDIYAGTEEKNVVISSVADNGEFVFGYNIPLNSAKVDSSQSGGYKGQQGLDFHPDVFRSRGPISIVRVLKNLRDNHVDNPFKVSISKKGDDLLELEGQYKIQKVYEQQVVDETAVVKMVLDPRHSFRLVEYYEENKNVNGLESLEMYHMTVEWADYGVGEGYPKSIKNEFRTVLSLEAWRNPPSDAPSDWPRERKSQMEIVIDEFQPNVKIDKKLFTLDGMGIRQGAKIVDMITGINYRYGETPIKEEMLQSLLDESKAANDVNSSFPMAGGQMNTAASGRNGSDRSGVSQTISRGNEPTAGARRMVLFVIGIVAVGTVAVVVGFKQGWFYRKK